MPADRSNNFRRERNDFHELFFPQFAGDGPEYSGAARLTLIVQQDGGVVIEAYIGTIPAADFLLSSHHHRPGNFPLLDGTGGYGGFHRHDDDVADGSPFTAAAAEDAKAFNAFGSGIISHN